MTIALIFTVFAGLFVIGAILHPEEFRAFVHELRQGPRSRIPFGLEAQPPSDCFVDEGQGWSSVEPDGTLRIGAGPVLLTLIGTPDDISLPEPGDELEAGHRAVTLRRGQRSVDLAALVHGHVVEVNEAVMADPSLLTRDPFGRGWLVRVSPSALAPVLERRKAPELARQWLHSELSRLRDAATSLAAERAPEATMLDGGLPIDGLSEHLDDHTWERLVRQILGR